MHLILFFNKIINLHLSRIIHGLTENLRLWLVFTLPHLTLPHFIRMIELHIWQRYVLREIISVDIYFHLFVHLVKISGCFSLHGTTPILATERGKRIALQYLSLYTCSCSVILRWSNINLDLSVVWVCLVLYLFIYLNRLSRGAGVLFCPGAR